MVATVFSVTVLTGNAVSADSALIESGDEGEYKYELYSNGELKIRDMVIYGDTVYQVSLSMLNESILAEVKTVTVDMTGVKEGCYIQIGTSFLWGDYDRVCNATKLTFLNAPDNYSYDIVNLPKLSGENIVFPEGVKIDALWLENLESIDSFEFLSKYSVYWLDIGLSGDLKKADLTSCNAGRVSIHQCAGLEEVKFPRKASIIDVDYCASLTQLRLPAYCEYVSVKDCGKLRSVYVNAGLKSANNKCFERCNNLTDICYSGSALSFDAITLFKWNLDKNPVKESGFFKDITGKYTVHYAGQGWNLTGEDMWIYLDQDGNIMTGWQQIDSKWYFFDEIGVMLTGWQNDGGAWYLLKTSGAMVTGWQEISGAWYYFGTNGKMTTGWKQISGSWYYFGSNGKMKTGWQQIGGTWYYFAGSGAMVTGWKEIGGVYYFFKSNGAMAANEYCGGYRLDSDGKWTYTYKASWKKDSKGWWYGDSNGWYAKNETWKIDGKDYNFDKSGYCTNP